MFLPSNHDHYHYNNNDDGVPHYDYFDSGPHGNYHNDAVCSARP